MLQSKNEGIFMEVLSAFFAVSVGAVSDIKSFTENTLDCKLKFPFNFLSESTKPITSSNVPVAEISVLPVVAKNSFKTITCGVKFTEVDLIFNGFKNSSPLYTKSVNDKLPILLMRSYLLCSTASISKLAAISIFRIPDNCCSN